MIQLLKVIGWIIMSSSIFVFVYFSHINIITSVISTMISFVLGYSFVAISNLMLRVTHLEKHCKTTYESHEQNDLPQKKCNQCQRFFDFDYPKCPYCKNSAV